MPAIEGSISAGLKGLVGGMLGGEGGFMGVTGGITKLVGLAMGIHGAISIIVSMFKPLLSVAQNIFRLIGLILKPITDILAIGLMTIIFLLKPVAQFFNTLMRPYILKAMAAMRAGGAFLAADETEKAFGSFLLGAQYLIKPFTDLMINSITTSMAAISEIIGQVLGGPDSILGGGFFLVADIIRAAGNEIIQTTNDLLDIQLGNVLAEAATLGNVNLGGLQRALEATGTDTTALTNSFETGIIKKFGDLDAYLESGDTWITKTIRGIEAIDIVAEEFFKRMEAQQTEAESRVIWTRSGLMSGDPEVNIAKGRNTGNPFRKG